MLTTIILALLCGISLGLLLAVLFLRTLRINCPKCKQSRFIREIIVFRWKSKEITGQPCKRCQTKPQTEIF